jgi:hypothetical protein
MNTRWLCCTLITTALSTAACKDDIAVAEDGSDAAFDAQTGDATAQDVIAEEAGLMDVVEDARADAVDGEPADVVGGETGAQDSGTDAGDAAGDGATDANETGADGSPVDSGDGAADAGPEAGDAGSDAPTLVPCTVAGQTGCVQCGFSNGGVCTPTEAAFVERDIRNHISGLAPDAPDPNGSCYACLDSKFCIDDKNGTIGNECGDSTDAGSCLNELYCILNSGDGGANSSCASALLENCYCGPAEFGSACAAPGAGAHANGVCKDTIASSEGFPVTDNNDILRDLELQANPGGMAAQIIQCGLTGPTPCGACFR